MYIVYIVYRVYRVYRVYLVCALYEACFNSIQFFTFRCTGLMVVCLYILCLPFPQHDRRHSRRFHPESKGHAGFLPGRHGEDREWGVVVREKEPAP